MSFFSELKRRNVFKVGVAYAIVAWLLVQVIGAVNEPLNLPDWFDTVVILFLLVGFPITLIMAWVFDLTPEGIQVSSDDQPVAAIATPPSQKLNYVILGFIALAVGFLVADRFMLTPSPDKAPKGTSAGQSADSSPASRAVRRSFIPLGPTIQSPGRGNLSTTIALSPDGRRLMYVALVNDTPQLFLRELDQVEAQAIPGTEGAAHPFFSPDGEWVGFVDDTAALQKVAVRGGPVQMLTTEASSQMPGDWASDETIVFMGPSSGVGNQLTQIAATGGTPEPIEGISNAFSRGVSLGGWPQVLPDGAHVLFTIRPPGGNARQGRIAILSPGTDETKILIEGAYNARYARSGHIVFVRSGSLWAVPFDLERMELTGAEVPVLDGVQTAGRRGATAYAFSDDGLLAYLPGNDTDQSSLMTLVLVDREGREEVLDTEKREHERVRFSPDGKRIAYSATDSTNNTDIWTYDLARGVSTRLTSDLGTDNTPLWTPDGQRLVYFSTRREDGVVGMYWRPADGSGEEELLKGDAVSFPWSFSSDGNQLIFIGRQELMSVYFDVRVMSFEEEVPISRPLLMKQFNHSDAVISPDGRWLAYVTGESGQSEVYVRPFPNVDDGRWQVSSNGGRDPRWGPEGDEIFYREDDAMMWVGIEVEPEFQARRPEVLFTGNYLFGTGGATYDISPDGQRFLMRKAADTANQISEQTMLVLVDNWFEELKQLAPPDPL